MPYTGPVSELRPGEHYPSKCPACECDTAKPKRVSTVPDDTQTIRLTMLCSKCAHEWTHDKISPKPEV